MVRVRVRSGTTLTTLTFMTSLTLTSNLIVNIEEAQFSILGALKEASSADLWLLPQEQLSLCTGPQSGALLSEAFRNVFCKYPDGHPPQCTAVHIG